MAVSAVLLAAGYATRLYPLTKDRPKSLLPLGEGAVLTPILEAVAKLPQLSRTLLVTNHRFAKQFQGWASRQAARVEVVDDGTATPEDRLGAIGDLQLCLSKLPAGDDALVVGTDNLFSWSLDGFVAFASAHRPNVSIGVWEVPSLEDAKRFGVVELDDTGRVKRLVEKSPQPPSRLAAL